ncbi:helix-turn-helix transcriptional regulator [Morganella morganii]|nr:helix-turn-helix transcriptional regulator [Morganella morganii]
MKKLQKISIPGEKRVLCSAAPEHKIVIKNINRVVGHQLKKLRREHNLSGAEFGEITGVSQQQISRYEHGITPVSIEMIFNICVYFKIPLRQFLAPLMILTE